MGTLQPQDTPPRAVYHVGNRTPGVNVHSSTTVKTNNSSLGPQHTEISLSAFCGWQGPRQRAMMQPGKPNFQALNEPTKTKAGRWEGWIRMENRSPPAPHQVFSSSRLHSLYLSEACRTAYRQPASQEVPRVSRGR